MEDTVYHVVKEVFHLIVNNSLDHNSMEESCCALLKIPPFEGSTQFNFSGILLYTVSLLFFVSLAGDDYISVRTTVTFGVGSVDGSPSCFDVTIDNDMAFEKSESFSLHIAAIEDNVEAHTEYFTIEIMDDDGECFVVSSAAFYRRSVCMHAC